MTEREIIKDEEGKVYIEWRKGDKLTNKEQQEGFKKHNTKKKVYSKIQEEYGDFYFKQRKSIKGFEVNTDENSDLARLLYALTYMDYDRILKTENGAYIDKSVLFKIIGVDRKIFNKWFNKMVEENIFMYLDETYIAVMDEEYIKGTLPQIKNSHYTKLFNNTIREIYETNKGKNMNAMGLIFKMIPFIHKDTNMVCVNPKVLDESKIKYVNTVQIANELGYGDNISRMTKMFSKFTLSDGLPIMLFISNGDRTKDKIMMNPSIMYGGKLENLPKTYNLFKSYATNTFKING